MFKNYFIISCRNLWRNKIFSLINILGLSIGISAALVIYLIVQYDFSFDKFEKDNDRIYRVVTDMKFAGNPFLMSGVPAPLPQTIKKEITGVQEIIGFQQFNGDATVSVSKAGDIKPTQFKNQSDIIFSDENYLTMLSYQWLAGSPHEALKEPFRVVLSEQRAKIYFPSLNNNDIIGQRVIYNDSIITTVSGIVKNLNEHSDFIFKEFISLPTIPGSGLKGNYSWTGWQSINSSSQLFVKLAAGRSTMNIESQLKTIIKKYRPNDNKDDKSTTEFRLQPFNDLHFNSNYGTYGDHIAHKPTLYGLLTVAAFLLMLGCINFINLTTAQSSQRAKEIGLRKTMGSSRKQLIFQFLSETFLITFLGTLFSVFLTPLLLEVFKDFIPKDVNFDLLHRPDLLLFLVSLVIAVSVFAGFYPALILSRYNPVMVLKNQAYAGTNANQKAWLRKVLTISQFFIAQVFIMATLVASKQIYYVLNTDLGFKKDAIISFQAPYNYSAGKPDTKRFVLLNELQSLPGIQLISLGGGSPASSGWGSGIMKFNDGKTEIETDVQRKTGDTNYLRLYQIKLLAGRNILPGDTTKEYLINETYLHILGFQKPRDVLNKYISGKPVVGVMADFHQQSLHSTIKPLIFDANANNSYTFHVSLKPQDAGAVLWSTTINNIQKKYKNLYPESDFKYSFFDESIAKFYKAEQDIASMLEWGTGLAVFISCMGLLGLVIYTTNNRRKEIGVRKVLGASISGIVQLLSKDFIKLILIAFLMATPLAWWIAYNWLQDFAYRTTISWWLFVLSGLLMIVIALITLSFQTIRAAAANPVNSLRTE